MDVEPAGPTVADTDSLPHRIPSVAEYLRAELERRIVAGALPPGERVREEAVAREFGTSRSPVREAFKMLEGAGLLTQRPRRGVVVTEFSLRDVWEVYSLQKALYNLGLELCEDKLTSAHLQTLDALVEGMTAALAAKPPDIGRYQDLNRRFHLLPIELSGHRRLLELSTGLDAQVKRFSAHSLGTDPRHLARSMDYHRRISTAIRQRDIKRAQVLVSEHVDQALVVLARRLGAGDENSHEDSRKKHDGPDLPGLLRASYSWKTARLGRG